MDWRNWNLPMDAGRGDAIIGTTEDGRPIYRSQLGTQYWQTPRAPKPKPDVASLLPAYGGQYETSKTAPAWAGSQPGLGDLGWALGGVLGAVMSGVSAPGRALRGQPVTKGDVINTALDWGLLSAPMSAPRGALRAGGMADDAPKGIKAYHGSPHDFDQFDMSKIGTGEGAQAYGHGLYFAEAESTAKSYRDTLSGGKAPANLQEWAKSDPKEAMSLSWAIQDAGEMVGQNVSTPEALNMVINRIAGGRKDTFHPAHDRAAFALDEIEAAIPDEVKKTIRERFTPAKGHMYEVNINANPDDFLDWDAPLSEQPQKIRDALGPRLEQFKAAGAKFGDDPIGEFLWRLSQPQVGIDDSVNMSRGLPEQASGRLREAGIPGIKYLDAGSRGAGTGSRNYVVFDDKLISILRKYGLLPALLGGSGIFNQQQPQG